MVRGAGVAWQPAERPVLRCVRIWWRWLVGSVIWCVVGLWVILERLGGVS